MQKSCVNCKHLALSYLVQPCTTCVSTLGNYTKWEVNDELLTKMEALLTRFVAESYDSDDDSTYCIHCRQDDYYHEIRHEPNCLMVEAQALLEEINKP